MRKVMIVVAVLMVSCHVSMFRMSTSDGAHNTRRTTQKVKK